MDIKLYVYDLTRGMARAMSQQLLGIHIEAVYHTSLVFNNIEYFFGAGVQTCRPGTTHHGQPMEIVPMGQTRLPLDMILEYLESLKEIYAPESYDLFEHNCNNFTNDFSMFLVGKGIPDHITGLPRRVLETPFGQMLKPQIDASMRSITQAPVPPAQQPVTQTMPAGGSGAGQVLQTNGHNPSKAGSFGSVISVTDVGILDKHLQSAANSASTIFFTSSTCAPCRIAYPTFDQLAEQYPKALFVKVDIDSAREIGARYQIRATPTFMTFSRGVKQDEWSGADPTLLRVNVERAITQTFPPHPHSQLRVPTLQFGSMKPISFAKVPPLDKLTAKLGTSMAGDPEVVALRDFIRTREAQRTCNATLPDFHAIGSAFSTKFLVQLPLEVRFAAVDLLRCAMADARVSGFFAAEEEEQKQRHQQSGDGNASPTIPTVLQHVIDLDSQGSCPHNLRLVTLQLACNLFASPLTVGQLSSCKDAQGSTLGQHLVQLVATPLLSSSSGSGASQQHQTARAAAAALAFNLAVANYRLRREEQREALDESVQVELAASLIETLGSSSSGGNDGPSAKLDANIAEKVLYALGYLLYFAPPVGEEAGELSSGGELNDLCQALDARNCVLQVAVDTLATESGRVKSLEALKKEVASLLDS